MDKEVFLNVIKAYKEFVIEGLGGENYINRVKNLEKLRNF